MSLAQRLINRTGALARKIKRNAPEFEKINLQTTVLSDSDRAQKLVLSAQRQTDPSWGNAVLAQKIEVAKLLANAAALALSGSNLQATLSIGSSSILQLQALADAPSGIDQITSITCVADNNGSLNNKYFLINSANNLNQYYVWFDVAGGGIDPSVSNRIGLPVSIPISSSASGVAAALAAVLTAANGGADFSAAAASAIVTVTYASAGPAALPVDQGRMISSAAQLANYVATPPMSGTGFSFAISTLGQAALSLASKYFLLYDSAGSVGVWYKVGGTGTAPVGPHRTIEVDVASLASAATVASATAAALHADSHFVGSNSSASLINAVAHDLGNLGVPGDGTSTFPVLAMILGSLNSEALLHIKAGDLAEVLSGQLIGNFYTIQSISNNVITFAEDVVGYGGESAISLRFEMRTTKPAIINPPDLI